MSWKVFALLSALFAAFTALFGKWGVEKIPSNAATLIRTVIIAILVGVVVMARREWPTWHSIPRTSWLFLILSAIATGLSWMCYYRALQLGPASAVVPIDKLSVVLTLILAAVFLGERIGPWQYLGSALISAGVVLIVWK